MLRRARKTPVYDIRRSDSTGWIAVLAKKITLHRFRFRDTPDRCKEFHR